jgi:putative transcriptional regulator
MPPRLTGSLLLAHPNLIDPNFRRSVVVISADDPDQGSLGFVMSHPTGKTVGDFVESEELGAFGEVPVYFGGPVGRDQLTFAIFNWQGEGAPLECETQVSAEEAAKAALISPFSVKAFVGYAGWAQGQLLAELKQHSWVVRPPVREVLDATKSPGLWRATMRDLGGWFKLMSAAPDDPSLN